MKKRSLMFPILLGLIPSISTAATTNLSASVAQPTTCIQAQFKDVGTQYWKSVTLVLTNACGQAVDFQNATINFKSKTAINTTFWGTFSPLSYPDNALNISSQAQADGNYLASLNLHFPSYSGGATSVLPAGKSFQIQYGVNTNNVIPDSTLVYVNAVVGNGTLTLTNTTAKCSNISQAYGLVHVTANGQIVKDVQLPWKGSTSLSLAAGSYQVSPENIMDTQGNTYQAVATPSFIALTANQKASSNIAYTQMPPSGQVKISLQPLPSVLSGYTNQPSILLVSSTGGSASQTVNWDTTTVVPALVNGTTYSLSTEMINFNTMQCSPLFTPANLVASSITPPTSLLSYQCVQMRQDLVTINVENAPTTVSSILVTFTPADHSTPVTQEVFLNSGSGTATVSLMDGMVYQLSMDPISGYTGNFSPQPFTATENAVETITLAKEGSRRVIGFLPGWVTPPSAQALASSGYTHIMVAFGVFNTTTPGVISSAFSTITPQYIQSLKQAGIKVLLSLGGASTSIPNTSVDFHSVLSSASSPDVFKQTFVASLQELIRQNGFDGFDIDIEHGLNGGGTFAQPQGDIAVLADIINTMYKANPNLLITLTPQVANISATSGFDATWGNYASLAMQTSSSLAWVGIQLYNTGCAYGIDKICYSPTNSPDFSVAMATDLLADWPATAGGRATGFQPYVAKLKPSQVVIGYPAPNAAGSSDGSPVTPNATIKRAFQCLKTATASASSCDGYVPPKAYGMIGGVFNWEVIHDQNNQFQFARDLSPCVKTGVCDK